MQVKPTEAVQKKPPTQRAIAELAGVAQETVSHILNGNTRKHYSAATVENVKRIAGELGYSPNRASRTMRKGRSNLIAVIHFGSRFRTGQDALSYIPQAIRAKGYDYLVNDLQWHGNDPQRVVADLIASRVEGVILVANVPNLMPDESLQRLMDAGISIVSLYGTSRNRFPGIPLVCGDVEENVAMLVNHLLSLGHSRILSLTSNHPESRISVSRSNGFAKGFAGRGNIRVMSAEEFDSTASPWEEAGGSPQGILLRVGADSMDNDNMRLHYLLTKKLYERGVLPDALMAINDQGAFGTFTAAFELGIKIPQDLAVTGVDNDPFGEYPAYRLTTLQPEIVRICEVAVDLLLDRISRKAMDATEIKPFVSRLIVRGSCGASSVDDLQIRMD